MVLEAIYEQGLQGLLLWLPAETIGPQSTGKPLKQTMGIEGGWIVDVDI